MSNEDHITHQGLITNIHHEKATIQLILQEECHSCGIKEFCGVTDEDRSHLDVPRDDLKVGDEVVVKLKPGTGLKAMFWAYIFPFLLIVTSLIVGNSMNIAEYWSGLFAVSLLAPYYLGLYWCREYLAAGLKIDVSKL